MGIENLEIKKKLGLEPEDAKEPVNIIILDDAQRKRYLRVMPLHEFKEKIKELPMEQIKELAQFAIANELVDFDKCEILKKITGTDVIGTIQMNKADQEAIKEE